MKLQIFEKIVNTLKEQSDKSHALYKMGIDLMDHETGYVDAITLLLRVYYGKEGEDWISWYVYERDSITGEPNKAWDKDGNEICYDIPSLWKCVEEIRCAIDFEEYVMPTDEELAARSAALFTSIFGIPPSDL